MSYKEKIELIKKKISGKILFNENLSKYSWFNLGGPAKIFFKPENLRELSFFLKKIDQKIPIKVLGMGSNTLIRDGGFEGIIVKLGKNFSKMSIIDKNLIVSGASALDKMVSNFAAQNSLSGLEFLSCIPGSIGGAIKMNSGCYNEEIANILVSLQAIDFNGNLKIIPSSEINFHYRGSNLPEDLIFISATFKTIKSSKSYIVKKLNNLVIRKKLTQPSKIKTCGSTFKNTNKEKAWKLIKLAKCEKMTEGNASISNKHCNFFVNKGGATALDLEKLIFKVKKEVLKKTGIKLALEVQIIGKKL